MYTRGVVCLCLLAMFASVFAGQNAVVGSVEEKCAFYFDDCSACLADSDCGWCGEYCTAVSSGLCDVELVRDAGKCPAETAPVTKSKKQSSLECITKNCNQCIRDVNCAWCTVFNLAGVPIAGGCLPSSNTALCSNIYADLDTVERITQNCPIHGDTRFLFQTTIRGSLDRFAFAQALALSLNTFNDREHPRSNHTDEEDFYIVEIRDGTKRSLNEERQFAVGFTTYTWFAETKYPLYPQNLLDSDLSELVSDPNNLLGMNAVSTKRTDLQAGSGSLADNTLSDGQLAGIIIGCILGALVIALVAALVYFLYFKKRVAGYPAPFRSPAASFRP